MVQTGTRDVCIASDAEGLRDFEMVPGFAIARTATTVAQFSDFVADTGYVTEAEKAGKSFVFHTQVAANATVLGASWGTEWWQLTEGACWKYPGGGQIFGAGDHPVVHVSRSDAEAFAIWANGRLPSETEWEYAARGGLGDVRFPWGDTEPPEGGGTFCNTFEGDFPRPKGSVGTVAANALRPNGYGLFNMCGNTWEWTRDSYANDAGPDPLRTVLKGGSFLCHESYCYRYRIAARIGVLNTSTTSHQGFRLAFDVPKSDRAAGEPNGAKS